MELGSFTGRPQRVMLRSSWTVSHHLLFVLIFI